MVTSEHGSVPAGLRPPRPRSVSAWQLWFGFLGGMVAFALHLLTVVWATPLACTFNAVPLHLASALFLLMGVAALVVSLRSGQRLHARERGAQLAERGPPGPWSGAYLGALLLRRPRLARVVLAAATIASPPDGRSAGHGSVTDQRSRFMALGGTYLNLLAVAVIAFSWAATFVLDPCLPGRYV